MLSIINSSNLIGIESFSVKVEVDISKGLPSFNIVGLASTEIKESRERVKSAIINSGFKFENARIVVNLSPADMKKEGSYFDLPIAIGLLNNHINNNKYLDESVFVGELSLDGNIRRVRGVIPIILGAKANGIKRVFIPKENTVESYFIDDIEVIPVETLKECINAINMKVSVKHAETKDMNIYDIKTTDKYSEDFEDVKGNYFVKRASEIAAAGNHNLLMVGPPGSGKTMIAKRIRTILPNISKSEMLEVSKIYSSAGLINDNIGIINQRPYRSPHHTSTKQALIGGGYDARPGEVVLAHRGVLFLDEIAEFDRKILETLRQPIEDNYINISRVKHNLKYPCNILLVGSMNPCPCGYYMSDIECKCKSFEIDRYINKISGPLLDRFDIFVEVNSVTYDDIHSSSDEEKSSDIKYRVEKARQIQESRFKDDDIMTNNEINSAKFLKYCNLDESANKKARLIFDKYKLSNRSYSKLLKLSRTIADLEESETVEADHVMEAFSYRKAFYTYFV